MNTRARRQERESAKDYIECDAIEAPVLITPLHVQDRETSKVAGAPKGWRKLEPLEAAYAQDRLGPKDSNAARDRYDAGRMFTRLWDASQSAGRDSTQAFDFCGGGQGVPLTLAQQSAIRRLVAIELHLGVRDRTIIRGVCAYGHNPSEAMELAKLGRDTRVTPRLCEALDALCDAIERTAKSGKRDSLAD